jgi:UDP-N-acetylmuramoyl-tripeptide--D-alanyl-D-alanine ligase
MSVLTFADLIEGLAGQQMSRGGQVITGASVDPLLAIPGSLFIATASETIEDDLAAAFQRGALFALVPDSYQGHQSSHPPDEWNDLRDLADSHTPLCIRVANPVRSLQTLAAYWRGRHPAVEAHFVTGTVGKTTTKDLIAEVLDQRFRTLTNAGSLGSDMDIPLALLGLSGGHDRAVLELNVPGQTGFFGPMVQPRIGVITNVGASFSDGSGSQAELAFRIGELLESLPGDGVAVLNYDDPWVRDMHTRTDARVFTYGLTPQADLWADDVVGMGLDGIHFRLHYRDEAIHLRVPMIGRHSVHTALRAAAVGLAEEFSWQSIVRGLQLGNTQLRLVAVRSYHGALILDDTYNASLESSLAALNLLDEMGGRKIALIGAAVTEAAAIGHQMVGHRAAQVADYLITVGHSAGEVAAAARNAWMPSKSIVELEDLEQAVEHLDGILTEDDVLLIKGPQDLELDRITAALEADS